MACLNSWRLCVETAQCLETGPSVSMRASVIFFASERCGCYATCSAILQIPHSVHAHYTTDSTRTPYKVFATQTLPIQYNVCGRAGRRGHVVRRTRRMRTCCCDALPFVREAYPAEHGNERLSALDGARRVSVGGRAPEADDGFSHGRTRRRRLRAREHARRSKLVRVGYVHACVSSMRQAKKKWWVGRRAHESSSSRQSSARSARRPRYS